MNTEILKRLSVEQLFELDEAVKAEINARIDYRVLPGRKGRIFKSPQEKPIPVIVQRVNAKTVSCIEEANPNLRWKVSPEYLRMDGVPYEKPKRPNEQPDLSEKYTNVQTW